MMDNARHLLTTTRSRVAAAIGYHVLEPCWWLLHRSGVCSTALMLRGCESTRWHMGRFGVWLRHVSSLHRVPAYRDFVQHSVAQAAPGETTRHGIPMTDKANYVNAYSMASRCVGGTIPPRGVLIDESSGSSGQPTNWIRGVAERNANARTIRRGLEYRFGHEPLFVINAFALGPWATGINLTLALSSWCRLKSLGPDIAKIVNTLTHFGPSHHYLILGYPPFLKQLVDSADVNWSAYTVSFVYGGEGMSESMRRYLQTRGVARVYGSYGASDLELNIAAETDLTIALRQLMETRPEIASRIAQHGGTLPMVFQFNPADFFVESTPAGEMLVTVCRPGYVAPKVRYNIHDLGHVMRYPALRTLLAGFGINIEALAPRSLNLPLLFLYGRSDMSVTWYGCTIPPADIQDAVFRTPALSCIVDGFQLQTFEDGQGDKQLVIAIETRRCATATEADEWSRTFFDAVATVNQDFRESRRIAPPHNPPRLELYAQGTGPFDGTDNRIKRQYVAVRAA